MSNVIDFRALRTPADDPCPPETLELMRRYGIARGYSIEFVERQVTALAGAIRSSFGWPDRRTKGISSQVLGELPSDVRGACAAEIARYLQAQSEFMGERFGEAIVLFLDVAFPAEE